ncbi:hypothetical protein FRC02_005499 [Tulasnella sp. 418]|nr:hypothetical protein FRC02_005499 [Tulasnella sp. 418]
MEPESTSNLLSTTEEPGVSLSEPCVMGQANLQKQVATLTTQENAMASEAESELDHLIQFSSLSVNGNTPPAQTLTTPEPLLDLTAALGPATAESLFDMQDVTMTTPHLSQNATPLPFSSLGWTSFTDT